MGRSHRHQTADGNRLMRAAWRRSYAGLAVILLFSIFVNLLKLATPLYVLQILDRIPASRSTETLVMLTVMAVAAVLTGAIIEVFRRRMFLHWGAWIEQHFGPKLVHAGLSIQTVSGAMAPSKALRDLSTIRLFVSGSGILAWLDVVWAPLFVTVVYLIDPLLASIVLIGIVAVLALGLLQELMTRSSRDAARRAQVDGREWVAAAGVLGRIAFRSVEKAMLKWRELVTAKGAYSRVRAALGAEASLQTSMVDNQLPAPLVIQDVGHRYANQPASVIKRISVTLAPGQVLCVRRTAAVR